MNPSKRIISKSEIYKGVGKITDPAPLDPRFESCWELPGSIGAGTVLAMELRQGLDLLVFDCSLRKSLVSSAEDLPTIGFNFMVAGGIMGQFPGKREAEIMRSGQNSVAYSPDQSGSMKNLTQSRMRIVSIQISLNAFNTFFPLGPGTCDLAGITAGRWEKHFHTIDRTNHLMQVALHQILNCPFHGLTKRLYMESRALELIAYKLDQLSAGGKNACQSPSLRSDEIDRIHDAGDILTARLENPPGIKELTRTLGLTHVKLQRGFREIYHTTPFGYLRRIRLDKARMLMEDEGLNVTETAYAVGYSSLSHFAKAFKEQFGISPSHYRRQLYH